MQHESRECFLGPKGERVLKGTKKKKKNIGNTRMHKEGRSSYLRETNGRSQVTSNKAYRLRVIYIRLLRLAWVGFNV